MVRRVRGEHAATAGDGCWGYASCSTCGGGVDVIGAARLRRGRRIRVGQVGLHVEDRGPVDEVTAAQVQHITLHALKLRRWE